MSKEDLENSGDALKDTTKDTSTPEAENVSEEKSVGAELDGVDTGKSESKEDSKDDKSVPLSKYMKEKKKRQDLEVKLAEAGLDSDEDDEAGSDPEPDQAPEAGSKLEADVAALKADKQRKEQDEKFNELYSNTVEKFPEYKDLADPAVIKQLALNPANKDKTMSQIMEDVYGHLIQGRPTIATDVPAADPEPGKVDVEKADRDPEYFKKVMADPKMKAEYNETIQDRIQ